MTNPRYQTGIQKSVNSFNISFITLVFAGMLLTGIGFRAGAQEFEAGPSGGVFYYLGDLNPGNHFRNVKPAYGLMIRYNIDSRWAVRLSAERGQIAGSAATSTFLPDRGLSFSSNIMGITALAEFNFFKYFTGSKRNAFTPYFFAGISGFFFHPKSGSVSLRALGTEGQNVGYLGRKPYGTMSFSIPFGIGIKLSLTQRFALSAYWQVHKTFTDYLDDVSTTYYLDGRAINPDLPEEYYSDPSMNHTPGMQRGNSKSDDWYVFTGLSLTYKFKLGQSKRCRDLEH